MKHKVTFLKQNMTVVVDDADYPYGHDGKPGSILDIALQAGIDSLLATRLPSCRRRRR